MVIGEPTDRVRRPRGGRWTSWRRRIAYAANNIVAARPWSIAIAVLVLVLLLSSLLAIVLTVVEHRVRDGGAAHDTEWHVWDFVRRTVGADDLDEDESALMRIAMLAISLLGVALVGTVAGSAAEGIGRWMRRLQGGRTPVVERRHTILVGWSPATIPAIREMIAANRSERGRPIVILANADKSEMDTVIRERIPPSERLGSRIVTRSGDCARRDDLLMVGAERARAIVLVPPAADSLHRAIGCMAAIKSSPRLERRVGTRMRTGERRLAIVAPVGSTIGRYVLEESDGGHGLWVAHEDLMARISAHVVAQPGTAAILEELLSFHGSAFYLWPTADRRKRRRRMPLRRTPGIANVVGMTFYQVQHGYVRGCPFGIRTADGTTILNPPPATVIGEGDQLLVAASDNTPQNIRFDRRMVPGHAVPEIRERMAAPCDQGEILLIGAGPNTASAVEHLASQVPAGTRIRIASSCRDRRKALEGLAVPPGGAAVVVDALQPSGLQEIRALIGSETRAILISPDGTSSAPASLDMETIHRLLQVRAVLKERGHQPSIAVEVLDDRDLELADVAQPDDVIVAERLVSLYCLQLAYQPLLRDVFEQMLRPGGVSIRLRPVEEFADPGVECDFRSVIDAASCAGMTAIGYRSAADSRSRSDRFGIEFNPLKKRRFIPRPGDRLIVLSGH